MKNLKKVAGLAIVLAFPLLAVTVVMAQGEGNRHDGNASEKGLEMRKPLKAENVKIHKKQMLSAKERAQADYVESQIKGKQGNPPGLNKDKPEEDEIATGILGNHLESEPRAKKYAIVIGLANYAGTANDLCVKDAKTPYSNGSLDDAGNPNNTSLQDYCMDEDSRNMEGVLTGEYYKDKDENGNYKYSYYNYDYDPDNVYRFSDSEATFTAIESAINTIIHGNDDKIAAAPGDEIVFFFSGHGAISDSDEVDVDGDEEPVDEAIVIYDQDYDEDLYVSNEVYIDEETKKEYVNYAAYYNDPKTDHDSAYIWDGQLKELFAEAATERILFVFDTCRAGGMDDLMEGYEENNNGRVLAASSTEWRGSYTYYLGGYGGYQESEGLFTHYFVKRAIRDKRADGYNALERKDPKKEDGDIAIEEAFQYAEPIVLKTTRNYQKPVISDLFTNDLLLGYYLPIP